MATPDTQRSFADVLRDIVGNIRQIFRSEVRLAQVEIKEKATRASKPTSVLISGIVLALYALGFLFLAVAYALSLVLAAWLSALIVAVLIAIIASGLIASGRTGLKQINPVPEKTAQTMKENVQWAKDEMEQSIER